MNVPCPDCHSIFRVDPAKVPAAGVQARCSVCGGVFSVVQVDAAAAPELSAVESGVGGAEVVTVSAPAAGERDTVAAREDAAAFPARTPADAAAVPPLPEVATPPRPARPVNPYLNNTPELRARRLARALVSDLVAYNPQKREQGLRDGTLRQIFRDEIRKSWDEYVEQIGANVAESTPHFQDALNDVLAGGRRVF